MYPAQVDVGIAPYEHGSRLRTVQKPNGSLTRPTKNFVGMPGLRCPHYFVSEYL